MKVFNLTIQGQRLTLIILHIIPVCYSARLCTCVCENENLPLPQTCPMCINRVKLSAAGSGLCFLCLAKNHFVRCSLDVHHQQGETEGTCILYPGLNYEEERAPLLLDTWGGGGGGGV